jgi:hypothetical protein
MVTTEPPQPPEHDIGADMPPVLVVEPVTPFLVALKLPVLPPPPHALKPSAIQHPTMRGSVRKCPGKPYLRRNEVSMD